MVEGEGQLTDEDRNFTVPEVDAVGMSEVTENRVNDERLQQLEEIRQGLEQVTDGLNEPIEPGIIDTVAVLNALKLPTYQSCEGHLDRAASAPWVIIYPPVPEVEGWEDDESLRTKVATESDLIKSNLSDYLEEFYNDRPVDDKIRLGLSQVAYGYRIQPAGLEWAEDQQMSRNPAELESYRREMTEFTDFLRGKFLHQV